MGNLTKIVYLSNEQAATLFANNTITVDGTTVNYSADDLYVTPDAGYLPLTGGTLSGSLTLAANPTANLQAATKQYVDNAVSGAGYLPLSGGTLTGALTLAADPSTNLGAATKQYVDTVTGNYVLKTGDTMTGALKAKGLRTYVSDTGHNASLNFGETADSTRVGRITMNTETSRMVFQEGNEEYFLPTPVAESQTQYDIVTTNGSYTLGDTLYAPKFTAFDDSYPSLSFATETTKTTDLGSINYDVTNQKIFFNCYTSGGGAEMFSLPVTTKTDSNWYSYDILTSKSAVTIAQGGTGATTAATARTALGAVNKAGDTMTGTLIVPSFSIQAASYPTWNFINSSSTKLGLMMINHSSHNISFREFASNGTNFDAYSLPTVTLTKTTDTYYDILTSNQTATVPTTSSSSVTINSGGGYIKLGKVCVVNMSITTSASLSNSTQILGNLPVPVKQAIVNLSNGTNYYTARVYNGGVWPNVTIPAASYSISGAYFTA